MDMSSEAKKKLLSEVFFIEVDNKKIYTKNENNPVVKSNSMCTNK